MDAINDSTDRFELTRRKAAGSTAPLNYWGCSNETDVLTDVLLGSAEHLRHLATSSLSRKYLRDNPADLAAARSQHDELASAYEHYGVRVHRLDAPPELPYQVYSRDSSCMTPFGPFITALAQPWRRGENYNAIRSYERLGIPIYDMVTAGTFEGGDFNVIEDGAVIVGCGGERTDENGARQVASWFEAEGWDVHLSFFDPYYVHIDLMVVMVADKLAAVCLDCTPPATVDWIKARGIRIIDVPFPDTVTLGCNVMTLGRDRVIAPQHSKSLIGALKAEGFEVAALDMSEISKTGGGIHCMAQALRRVPA
jgi:N-dimethylarginine dimethylaminohydrolase